jgi:hypothetical protein
MTRVAARVACNLVTAPAANSKAMVSALNMGGRGMSATVSAMATVTSGMTATMSSTGIHWRRRSHKSRHHERCKC